MSLLDVVEEEFGAAVRGSKSAKSAKSPLSDLKDLKEPRPSRSKLQESVVIDWGKSPLVQSVDKLSKELRESPDELREAAEDDWAEESSTPAKLIGFADSLAIARIRETGRIPDNYTSETECRHCGSVPIWPGCPPQVNGCPWCFNRLQGLPMPSKHDLSTKRLEHQLEALRE